MYIIQLILILIVAGGLIAYVGDKIGMKVGRKRLSLFGLRPKYTSIIITVVTGILIALSSLGVLIAGSENIRQALFDMQALLTKLDNLNQTVEAKNQRLTTLSAKIKVVKGRKLELKRQVKNLSLQQQALTKQVNNLAHNLSLFGKKYFYSLTGDIIYPKGTVVTSDSIRGNLSQEELNYKLQQLILQAKKLATKKGLTKVTTYSQQELVKAINILNKRDNKMIVRLLAAKNTFKNEKLKLNFDLYSDYKVYQTGDIILTHEVTFTKLADLEIQLKQLKAKLNQKVIQAGMLPNKQGKVVDLTLKQLYQLVDQLRQTNKSRLVKVVAKEDIWRDDSLAQNIKFKVES
ncbi:Protein of unknown function (DUF3084) [Halobacteroides halobius DSM 5150]|uniref:DUF3084 domain-containing protein n=1 Tax=Halobacteroides halobius (strain ATCC 35273 / DSM 5150 / MD-1) TaxID=748449 RepID=L0KD51_HALHC|nr:DUF3084 domain-containing protein [Halobacteroides halobius]AGB42284.1 Protein of unknown function (DUF3084) [Halobacteroides halobius DSM 5150]